MASETMLSGANAMYLEEMLRRYLADPSSVDPSWRTFFEGEGRDLLADGATRGPTFEPSSIFAPAGRQDAAPGDGRGTSHSAR